jgi:hypothetical protein
MKSKKIRDSARDEDCTLRLDGCRNNTETTVGCHAPGTGMKGVGMKAPDIFIMYGCDHCHSIIDGRKKGDWNFKDIVRAMAETQIKLVEKGLIKIL